MLNYITEKIFKGNKTIAFYSLSAAAMILIILIIILLANLFSNKLSGYELLEKELMGASEKYYNDNKDLLPIDGNVSIVEASKLVDGKYMKSLSDLYKDDTCDGRVNVSEANGEYLYTVQLNCTNYTTKTLEKEILSNLVTKNSGLYATNSKYIFKGEYVNNYIKFDNKIWRIIGIDSNGIKMYLDTEKLDKYVWDDRYNLEKESDYGKNVFDTSRMKEYLNNLYATNEFVSAKSIKYLVAVNWCIGSVAPETDLSKIDLCQKRSEKMYIGSFEVTDFANASLEPTCKKFDDTQCINYNYFTSINGTNWTLNSISENTYAVYTINMDGAQYYKAAKANTLRPVIYLNAQTTLKTGTGTQSDPYIVK